MQTYTTQMDAARKGIVTKEMEIVAKKEYRTTEEIRQLVSEGKVRLPQSASQTAPSKRGPFSLPPRGRWHRAAMTEGVIASPLTFSIPCTPLQYPPPRRWR